MNTQPKMLCEICQAPTADLRLIKWQEWDVQRQKTADQRLWVCAQCWIKNHSQIEQAHEHGSR